MPGCTTGTKNGHQGMPITTLGLSDKVCINNVPRCTTGAKNGHQGTPKVPLGLLDKGYLDIS